MNAELPLFKKREHSSESASTLDHDITPLGQTLVFKMVHKKKDGSRTNSQVKNEIRDSPVK